MANEQRGEQAMIDWVHKAHQVVIAHHGDKFDWSMETLETQNAEAQLDFCLGAYFLSDSNVGNIRLNDVSEAWRSYYRSHLRKPEQGILSPSGGEK